MGKLTDEQAAALAELQAIADAPDDADDYEVWIKNDKGHETRIPSKKAGGWLKEQFGISLDDAPPAGDDDGDGDGDGDGKDPKPKGGGYFSKRPK